MKIMNETLEMNQEQNVKSIEAVADVQTNLRFCPHVPTPPPIRLELVISITPSAKYSTFYL